MHTIKITPRHIQRPITKKKRNENKQKMPGKREREIEVCFARIVVGVNTDLSDNRSLLNCSSSAKGEKGWGGGGGHREKGGGGWSLWAGHHTNQ